MSEQTSTTPSTPLRRRQKYRARHSDHQSMRFECLCSIQYFCYTSLLLHIKKRHPEFYASNPCFSANNIISTINPQHGFRIRKVLLQPVVFRSDQENRRQKEKEEQIRKAKLSSDSEIQKLRSQYSERNEAMRKRLSEITFANQQLERQIGSEKMKIAKLKEITNLQLEMVQAEERVLSLLRVPEIVSYLPDNNLQQ